MRVKPAELSNKTSFWQDKHRAADETDESTEEEEEHITVNHFNMEVLFCAQLSMKVVLLINV